MFDLYQGIPTPTPPTPPTITGFTLPDGNDLLTDGTIRFVGYWNQVNQDGLLVAVQAIIIISIVLFGIAMLVNAMRGDGETDG